MEQRTPEWFAARLGKVTASRVADVIAKTKSGPSAPRFHHASPTRLKAVPPPRAATSG